MFLIGYGKLEGILGFSHVSTDSGVHKLFPIPQIASHLLLRVCMAFFFQLLVTIVEY